MSLTYGFYNALSHDRLYNAVQMSQIFDGIINDGVYMSIGGQLMVKATTGMTVVVEPGRAWFNHTWTYNDARLPIVLDDADAVVSRIDAIVLTVDTRKAVRVNSIDVIKGTPATTPVKPNIEPESDEVFVYPLAYVTINSDVSEVTQANIENAVGTSSTPFVTGIIETIDIDNLIAEWRTQWAEWLESVPAEFAQYVQDQKDEMASEHTAYTNYISTHEAEMAEEHKAYTEYVAGFESGMDIWEATQKQAFKDWFKSVQDILDEDTAGHLQNEIDNLKTDMSDYKEELDDSFTEFKNEIDTELQTVGALIIDSEGYVAIDYDRVKREASNG